MSDFLVRHFPRGVEGRVRQYASRENLSRNQFFLQLVQKGLEQMETEKERKERQREAFRCIRELREEIYRKYGRFEDSSHWIREDRESH